VNTISIGASTKAMWLAAIGCAIAFVVQWAQSGSAPAWLAGISGVLVILNNAFRSWQATQQPDYVSDDTAFVDALPAEATDAKVA
jgi:hypothetical protein